MHNEISIISDTDIGERIATELNANLIKPNIRLFEDGESKIAIPKIQTKTCMVIQSLYPPIDRHLVQVLMTIKKCNEYGIKDIYAIIPYLAYSRQDKEFLDGELISAKFIAELFESVGTTKLITIDIHSKLALSYFRIDAINISAIPFLTEFISSNINLHNPIVVSPDIGGSKRAEDFAKCLNTISFSLKKKRDRNTGKISMDDTIELNIKDRDILIIDDIISTGNSIIKAYDIIKTHKPRKVYVVCTHALLTGEALKRLKELDVEFISTNSIPNEFAKVDISTIITKSLHRIKIQDT